ncbi:acyl-CoA/acyl-ACP dehydrogenase [Acidovorax sp. SUPP2522]|uniref:acyl-CoA dehydrogenase family protein n=1 Tax=unclassified Acidovorax TaxID=2684926 RepID=UPI00234A0E4C|nr:MULTISPECIES: acyl-CoA dehydrogenase family protein [unclassified Acidovorax]WCM99827.1 acyl-CoA/acyl-ACP dehydrogenase [Acidovorax sp. GBBC 1281]GKT14788.1 acyl-CoA/acyl-ACP dehydrogenase [Acidovorax sp. SUPP2522]
MNAPLTAGQRARTLAAEFGARAAAHDREASFPHQNFADLQQAGLLALAAPRSLGGQGASAAQLGEVIGAVAQGCPATALVLTMQYIQHRGMGRPGNAWPLALARQLVQEAVQGVSLVNALRVEPELGSPARGGLPATVARRTAEGWRLSGHKVYSTGAPALRWYVVWARTDDAEPRTGSFLVRAGQPGVRIEPTWDHLGLRASGSHDVLFDGVAVPADHVLELRLPKDWARGEPAMQAEMAVMLGSLYTGVARAARHWLVGFLQERKPASLGAPLATLARAQEAVGRIEGLLFTNDRLIAGLAAALDTGAPLPSEESGLVKATTTHNAIEAVQSALALTSNHGLARKNPLERHLRDVLCGRVHTPQDDSVYLAAGRRALGL